MKNLSRLILCIILFSFVDSNAAEIKKNVLYLNSYHHGYQWSDHILEGIRNVLNNSQENIDLQIEYLDTKKYSYSHIKNSLFTLYSEKFRKESFDIIIVSDNNGFDFVTEYRETLFKGLPIVFCGINDFDSVDISSGNIAGVVENFDLAKTLDIIRRLHPGKKKMVVVGDQSATGRGIRTQIEKTLSSYKFPFEVEFWDQLTLEETEKRVANLTDDTFLFFFPWYQTLKGKFYTAEEVMEALYTHSSVPIYTAWDFLLGHGAVGGRLLSGVKHGQTAAEIAIRILHGEKANDIPVVFEVTGANKFDYKVMQRLNIDQSLLPDDAEIINSPRAFYELPKELFWTIMTSIFLLLIILAFLVVAMIGRRRVERKVLEQLSFQETLMDTIPLLVSWKDRYGNYLGANRTFIEFFDIDTPDGVVTKKTADVVFDRDYVRWSAQAEATVTSDGRSIRKMRKKLENRKGNPGWLEINKVPLRNQHGAIVGILTTAENVTKERNLEKQLLQSQKMEALGTLAGGIAHDFNNILTSIINSTELALGDLSSETQTAKDLERVLKAAKRGSGVVKRILSFSRPSKEGFRPTDLADVVSEVMSLMEASLPSSIQIFSKISSHGALVEADPTQMHQVILNLCTNSYHALREDGGSLGVHLAKTSIDDEFASVLNLEAGNFMRITVEDDGPGIHSDIIDNIFDPFFSTKDITEGTGLGLAVVHGIVKGHLGALQVISEPGEGTIFHIYLPLTTDERQNKSSTDSPEVFENLSILFVEDDLDQLKTIPRVLEDLHHQVVAVSEPKQALAIAQGNPQQFDLVLTDYDMPAMSGTELADILNTLPVILISGREDAVEAAKKCKNIVTVLIKPYDKTDLQRVLSQLSAQEREHGPHTHH